VGIDSEILLEVVGDERVGLGWRFRAEVDLANLGCVVEIAHQCTVLIGQLANLP
jgi:hypothetical protein